MIPAAPHAVITGGSGGLGQTLAVTLREQGWHVSAPGSRELDVRDAIAVKRFFENHDPELLVCSAGITRDAPLARLTEVDWQETWNINFHGALRCAEAALTRMQAKGTGDVIFISSYSALHPPIGQAAYATAKAALIGLTADLAQRHGSRNVRVNAILPGFMETRMTAAVTGRRRAEVLQTHALGRFNTCREVASFIAFLHRDLPHTSGQIFQLDSRTNFPRFPQQ